MILTLDVGLKNLAICVMSNETNVRCIKLWEVFNLLDDQCIEKCTMLTKKGSVCGKNCLYKYKTVTNEIQHTCKTHIPKNLPYTKVKIKKVKDFLLQDITRIVLYQINDIFNQYNSIFKI